ncbi:MAG TPA: phospholipase D-like domain-containing protein [Pyrinomonadaceae bacterium]|nr:phospholipase D-like domain-containing protein [Pyrinomonadaceae bacterium]
MRKRVKKGPLSVHAVAGSYVVLLGINMTESASEGVLGFAIERTDHSNRNRRDWLAGFKVFPDTKIEKGAIVSTREHPLQSFLWADMTTRLAHKYTYRVIAMRGKPGALKEAEEVSVRVAMEDEDVATHAVYFNRGVAGSQAYVRKFGNKRPTEVPNNAAWDWLSRGLAEAIVAFAGQAKGSGFGLRASIYEFQQPDVLNAFKEASQSGADVKVVFDARPNSSNSPNKHNRESIKEAGIEAITIPRTQSPSYISHNKFIVLLKKNKPVQVWTGSTNLTQGGIYGHSNVGHLVRDAGVAAKYLDYWEQLSRDPTAKDLRVWAEENTPVPKTLPRKNTTTCVFSPRPTLEALEWYTERMDKAPGAVFFTAAFGVNDLFTEVLAKQKDYLRYVLLESAAKDMDKICKDKLNKVAVAGTLGSGKFERWMREQTVPALNVHVKYIHTKYMLIDPLGADPLVISGSANFSNASTKNNDENMLLVRGDKRVADIYLGEFMRLFNHHYFRSLVKKFNQPDPATGKRGFLAPDDSWRLPYYVEGTPKKLEREYFA